jgi:hypothetical protein
MYIMQILSSKVTQLDGWDTAYYNRARAKMTVTKSQMNFRKGDNANGVVVEVV